MCAGPAVVHRVSERASEWQRVEGEESGAQPTCSEASRMALRGPGTAGRSGCLPSRLLKRSGGSGELVGAGASSTSRRGTGSIAGNDGSGGRAIDGGAFLSDCVTNGGSAVGEGVASGAGLGAEVEVEVVAVAAPSATKPSRSDGRSGWPRSSPSPLAMVTARRRG